MVFIKNFKVIVLSVLLILAINQDTEAAMDPKAKVLGSMAIYGTVGGALLGTATLAFDGSGRNVARGASLGLYAGLLFGSFVVISHVVGQDRSEEAPGEDYYPDAEKTGPYERIESEGAYPEDEENGEQSFRLLDEVEGSSLTVFNQMEAQSFRSINLAGFYLPLVNIRF